MTDEQIRLYAECRVAMPSPMIRLRSETDAQGRWCVIATRPPFKMARPVQVPRVILPPDELPRPDFAPVDSFPPERAGVGMHPSVLWDHDEEALAAVAELLAESVTRGFRRASLNVGL